MGSKQPPLPCPSLTPACATATGLPYAHLFGSEPALDPLVLNTGDRMQKAAAGKLQALVEAAVGQPLPAGTERMQPVRRNSHLAEPPRPAQAGTKGHPQVLLKLPV